MSTHPTLELVTDVRQVAAAHGTFNKECVTHDRLTRDLVRRTIYWVHDPSDGSFSPSKFSGFVGMDFVRYDLARQGQSRGVKFDGGLTQRAIEAALGAWRRDGGLAKRLRAWAEGRLGAGVFDGIDEDKWRFALLPVARRGGLAALAGGWEGSEELVDSLARSKRDGGRPAPEMR